MKTCGDRDQMRNLRHAAHRGRSTLAAMVMALTCVIASGASAAQCPERPYADTSLGPAGNLGTLKRQLLNYGCFGDYNRDLAEVASAARAFVEQRAGEVAKPALVLDIDETSLTNWPLMLADDFGYIADGPCLIGAHGACSQHAWERRAQAPPIQPTLDLFNAAKARGVAVFFITGRAADPGKRAATARNLHRAGYRDWAGLFLRVGNERNLRTRDYKTARRAAIAAKGYTIIANVGDQDSDLDGGYAERTFKLPNPFYFIP
jgi:hypothetical protein